MDNFHPDQFHNLEECPNVPSQARNSHSTIESCVDVPYAIKHMKK